MADNFADSLLAAIEKKGSPVCVGIDPVYDKLPDELRRAVGEGQPTPEGIDPLVAKMMMETIAIGAYCRTVLDLVAPYIPAVKPQSAYFERYGAVGVSSYYEIVKHARSLGLIVIGDVKRNDIGTTAGAYAAAHLSGPANPDSVTVNGYFGEDGIAPFIDVAKKEGRGVFTLVRTSNKSAPSVQDFADASGKKLYRHMAELVAQIGSRDGLVGKRGYSCLGAVVGATWPGEAAELREVMSQQIFLVPGYGAQGATAADCAASFKKDGTGAIVNASRSVIFAYQDAKYKDVNWKKAIEQAAKEFADDIKSAVWK